ncbi:unnamed protein product [Tetraodon nigroviridis]|uniref:(spotted green pufferfish) hypothetical protein n=1 Tax=Tetraodon nigroviridis TaxID=99883 RepID=Q4S5L4_TETNG|nr:unnamed protein product [Tetraodon nigroviridis]
MEANGQAHAHACIAPCTGGSAHFPPPASSGDLADGRHPRVAAFSELLQATYLLWMTPICGSVCEPAGVDVDGVVHKVGQR